jgi:hypothetical protein
MHDVPGQTHWHEPTGGQRAGFGKFGRPKTPYDTFMESEGIPIFRDIGVSKVQNLPLAPWKRTGGRAAISLLERKENGVVASSGAGAGALNAENISTKSSMWSKGRRLKCGSMATQRPCSMAEGLAVFDPGERVASVSECQLCAGAACSNDGAES